MTAVFRTIHKHRAWIVLALVLLFVAVVRLRLRDMPLERDEGEYAYAGQLLLQGIPPYKLAYNLKFPGTYAAYALMMLVYGQTAAGIHVGLLLVNMASIVMVFFLGRKLLDLSGGLVAATTFAVLSLSVSVLGLAAHASHFVVLAALGGTLLLLHAVDDGKPGVCFASGTLFGLAFLMKQPGILWGVFGLVYLAWSELSGPSRDALGRLRQWRLARRVRTSQARLRASDGGPPLPFVRGEDRPCSVALRREEGGGSSTPFLTAPPWKQGLVRCAWYVLGLVTPFAVMCVILWKAGVLANFVFWTFTYANEYVSQYSLFEMPTEHIRLALGTVFGPNFAFWILAVLGMVLMWWEERLRTRRWFLAGFTFASLVALSPGWYLRQHYFIFLLPAAALLTAIAIYRGLYLVRHDRTIELFLAVPILGLFPVGLGTALVGNGSVWFDLGPVAACREVYPRQMFPEDAELASFIRKNSPADARIAVLGSEPEIYFYARRRSATGYLYAYPLVEQHEHVLKMQEEMMREIEAARPEYMIFVNVKESWMSQSELEQRIFSWYEQYSGTNYDLVQTLQEKVENSVENDPQLTARPPGYLLLYQRKNAAK